MVEKKLAREAKYEEYANSQSIPTLSIPTQCAGTVQGPCTECSFVVALLNCFCVGILISIIVKLGCSLFTHLAKSLSVSNQS